MNDTNHEPKGCSETTGFTLPTDQTLDYVHRSRLNDALAEIDAQETRHTNEVEALRALLRMRDGDYQTAIKERDAALAAADAAVERNGMLVQALDNEREKHIKESNRAAALYRRSETERETMRATIDSLTALGQSLEAQLRELQAQPTFTAPPFKAGAKVFYVDYDAGSVLRCTVLLPIMEWHTNAPAPDVKYRVRFDSNGEATTVDECDVFGLIDEAVAALKGGE